MSSTDGLVPDRRQQGGLCSVFEQGDPADLDSGGTSRRRSGPDPQRCPAGDEDVEPRALLEELATAGRGIDDLLEVVEDEQHPAVTDHRRRSLATTGRLADPGDHLGRNPRGRQVNEQDAAREVTEQRMGDEDSEPGLAHATRPGQGQQPVRPDDRDGPLQLVSTADERGRRQGQADEWLGQPAGRPVQRRVLAEDAALELLELRRRIDPELVDEAENVGGGRRPSASAWRPERYRASMSWRHSRSRSGCSVTSAPSSAASPAWRPSSRSASIRPSRAVRRSSSKSTDLRLEVAEARNVRQRRAAPQVKRPAEGFSGLGGRPASAARVASASSSSNRRTSSSVAVARTR